MLVGGTPRLPRPSLRGHLWRGASERNAEQRDTARLRIASRYTVSHRAGSVPFCRAIAAHREIVPMGNQTSSPAAAEFDASSGEGGPSRRTSPSAIDARVLAGSVSAIAPSPTGALPWWSDGGGALISAMVLLDLMAALGLTTVSVRTLPAVVAEFFDAGGLEQASGVVVGWREVGVSGERQQCTTQRTVDTVRMSVHDSHARPPPSSPTTTAASRDRCAPAWRWWGTSCSPWRHPPPLSPPLARPAA
jgi:hypothetical protein